MHVHDMVSAYGEHQNRRSGVLGTDRESMPPTVGRFLVVLALLALTTPAAVAAQPLSISASVAVTWLDRADAGSRPPTFPYLRGAPSLGSVFPPAVVALWRGEPGWTFDAGSADAVAFFGWDGPGQGDEYLRSTRLTQGSVSLELAYVPATRTAFVNGLPVRLPAGHDVILVDHADEQPTVAGTLRVGGSEPELIEEFLGRSPDILAFARCDVALPEDASPDGERIRRAMQGILDERCQLMAGMHPESDLHDVPLELLPR